MSDRTAPARPWIGLTSKAGFQEADPDAMREFRTAILDGRWKLHIDRLDGQATNVRLYDLQNDPGEMSDVAKGHPDIVAKLSAPLDTAFAARRVVRPGSEGRAADSSVGVPRSIAT